VPGYEPKAWFGLFAPAGTPVNIVAKLNAEVQAMPADSEFRETVLGPYQMSPITLADRICCLRQARSRDVEGDHRAGKIADR
jgi:tripartite-type tricarboxylate transporter receptor subunit TctC